MVNVNPKICLLILILPFSLFGEALDQSAIDAMLDEIASSDPAYFKQRPKASRDFSPGKAFDFDYLCPICDEKTHYRGDTIGVNRILNALRTDVRNFRALGLAIELDERALCRKCCAGILPVQGEIVSLPESKEEREGFPWKVGDKLEIHSVAYGRVKFDPFDKVFWMWGEYVSKDGLITNEHSPHCRVDLDYVRMHPEIESAVIDCVREGDRITRCPCLPGDPDGWVRVDFTGRGVKTTLGGDVYDFEISDKLVGNYQYCNDKDSSFCPGRIKALAWSYGGRRVVIGGRDLDVAILYAFLKKRKTFSIWEHGQIQPLKQQLPRLRQILQGVEREVPKIMIRGKNREHGVLGKVKR